MLVGVALVNSLNKFCLLDEKRRFQTLNAMRAGVSTQCDTSVDVFYLLCDIGYIYIHDKGPLHLFRFPNYPAKMTLL